MSNEVNPSASNASPGQWHGVQGIDLPVRFGEEGAPHAVNAVADAQVCLQPSALGRVRARTIHQLVTGLANRPDVRLSDLSTVLREIVRTHLNAGAIGARLTLAFRLLVFDPALLDEGWGGWKPYPFRMAAVWQAGAFEVNVQVTVTSRSRGFAWAGGAQAGMELAVSDSLAEVHVRFAGQDALGLDLLARRIESALANRGFHAPHPDSRNDRRDEGPEKLAERVRHMLSQYYAGTRVVIRRLDTLQASSWPDKVTRCRRGDR